MIRPDLINPIEAYRNNTEKYISVFLSERQKMCNYIIQEVIQHIGQQLKSEYPNIQSEQHRGIIKVVEKVKAISGDKSTSTYEIKSLFKSFRSLDNNYVYIPKKVVIILRVITELLQSCTAAKKTCIADMHRIGQSDLDCKALLIRFHYHVLLLYQDLINGWEKKHGSITVPQLKDDLFSIIEALDKEFVNPCFKASV